MSRMTKNAPRALRTIQRNDEIWRLSLWGHTHSEIAEKCGLSVPRVQVIVSEKRKLIEEAPTANAEKLRKIETERLERLLTCLMPKALSGTVDAIKAAIAISDQLSRLWGLYMPTESKQIVDVRIELTQRLVAVLQREPVAVRQRILSGLLRPVLPAPDVRVEEERDVAG